MEAGSSRGLWGWRCGLGRALALHCRRKHHDYFWYASFLCACLLLAQVEKQEEKGTQLSSAFAQYKGLPCTARPYQPLGFLVPVFPDEVGGVDDDSEAFFIEQEHHFPSKRGR